MLYRNTDLVPDAPATLDDAFAAGEAAVAAGRTDAAFNLQQGELGDAYHMQPLFTSAGGTVFGRTPRRATPTPTSSACPSPARWPPPRRIATLGEKGRGILRRSVSGDNSIALFGDGGAAFLVSGPWARADLDTAGVAYAVSPIPGFADGGPAQPFTGVQAFYAASRGKNKAFAQEFISGTVNSEQAQRTLLEGTSLAPAMITVQQQAGAEDPLVATFVQAAQAGTPMPSIPAMAAVWTPLGQAYASIIAGEDPVPTLQAADRTITAAIGA